jgi:hypothetical protein
MLALSVRGETIDRVTLVDQIRKRSPDLGTVNGLSYLASLDDGLPEIVNLDRYVAIVKRAALLRRFIRETNSLTERAMQQEDPEMLFPAAAETIRKLQAETGQRVETAAPTVPQWPDPLHEDAFHGLAGEVVRRIEPHSEADPAALLAQLVIGFGSLISRGPHFVTEADKHHTNEYVVLVGVTSKARKGSSWGRIRGLLGAVDEHWEDTRIVAGLGSGEALVEAAGDEDRRVMVLEAEFARLLAVASREGTTISAHLRNAWDFGRLSNRKVGKKIEVTGAHVSMVGHITAEELRRRLDDTEIANGFANRILWVCARRSKTLPHGGGAVDFGDVLQQLQDATAFARRLGNTRVSFDAEACHLWEQVYADLSEGRPGLLGAVTSRAEAHVVRLALTYALLDRSERIQAVHLQAALALWNYCAASARFAFGDAVGDPVTDEILKKLRTISAEGLTRTDIRDLFARNRTAQQIDRALGVLASMGLAQSRTEDSGGRPITRWVAV